MRKGSVEAKGESKNSLAVLTASEADMREVESIDDILFISGELRNRSTHNKVGVGIFREISELIIVIAENKIPANTSSGFL